MTQPTGRPRGRPRKDAAEKTASTVNSETDDWKSLPWRRIYELINAEGEDTQEAILDKIDDDGFLEFITHHPPSTNARRSIEMTPLNLRVLAQLGKLFCTQEEAAGWFGVSRGALRNFFDREPYAREVFENGLSHAKISLRRKQLALADKNAPAAIFLGKNYLGQKDEHHSTTTQVSVTKMTDAQLEEMALAEAARSKGGAPKLHS